MSAAGPGAINGYPMFMSLRYIHREDWKLAFDAYGKEVARRKSNEDLFGENSPWGLSGEGDHAYSSCHPLPRSSR